jgi:hypothetical protein
MRDSTRYEKVEERNGFRFVRLKSGRLFGFWDARADAEKAESDMHRASSRMFKLISSDPELGDWDLERIESFFDNIESWIRAVRKEIERRRGTMKAEDRIARLRNTTGRTPEEAALFRKKADELERGLG